MASPASGSPLPISGTDPVTQAVHGNHGGANTVLRVIVETMLYPVSLDILHQIFQRFGKVLKIVTFTKNNSFQVSITAFDKTYTAREGETINQYGQHNRCRFDDTVRLRLAFCFWLLVL